MNEVHILPRFYREIRQHLLMNYLGLPTRPLILGISGRAGDGKSYQLSEVLKLEKVGIYRIHAADLESSSAGEPGKLIARTYRDASLAVEKGMPWAIILDDIDTTVGEWQQNTGTVNHQQVLAELMHLADSPVDVDRGFPRRVPLFITGNRMGYLYPPLRRHRRLRHFPWTPTREETFEVVRAVLTGYAEPDAPEALVSSFPDMPLAFYVDVKHLCLEKSVSRYTDDSRIGLHRIVANPSDYLRRISPVGIISTESLLAEAANLISATQHGLQDYTQEQVENDKES